MVMVMRNALRGAPALLARRAARGPARRGFASSSGGSASSLPVNPAALAAAAGVTALLLFGRGAAGMEVASEPVEQQAVEVAVPEDQAGLLGSLEERLTKLEKEFAVLQAGAKNQAFVFIKPHAVTDAVKSAVKSGLEAAGIEIRQEGSLPHSVIDEKRLIDTHYGAIASKAVTLKPAEQNVPQKGQAAFEKMFGESWEDAIKAGKVLNAADACKALGISGAELDKEWSTLTRGENLLKFGGGHYVGKVGDKYVINGFFMAMRDKYCQPPAEIHYFVVEWDPVKLSWEDFRGKVLGGTDPSEANAGSLRRLIFDTWEDLGLSAQPDVGDNGVHASASPFEAMAERVNWCGVALDEDLFGKAVLSIGVPEPTLKEWMADAQVAVDGKRQSIFDFLEDQDSSENLRKLAKLAAENKA